MNYYCKNVIDFHDCDEFKLIRNNHSFEDARVRNHGRAITAIVQSGIDNSWHTSNNEYSTEINFCPFCGIKL